MFDDVVTMRNVYKLGVRVHFCHHLVEKMLFQADSQGFVTNELTKIQIGEE